MENTVEPKQTATLLKTNGTQVIVNPKMKYYGGCKSSSAYKGREFGVQDLINLVGGMPQIFELEGDTLLAARYNHNIVGVPVNRAATSLLRVMYPNAGYVVYGDALLADKSTVK